MSHDPQADRHLDEQLRAAFAPLPADRLAAIARAGISPPQPRAPWLTWLLATAALCLLTFVLSRDGDGATEVGRGGDPALGAMWAAAYDDATGRGLANCCGGAGGCAMGGFDLDAACRARFEAPLGVTAGSGLRLVGAYEGLPTGGCMALLAESEQVPMCVFVMRREHDRGVVLPADKVLTLARREVGDLVVYGVSRVPLHAALDEFVVP